MHDLGVHYREVGNNNSHSTRKPSMVEVHLDPKELEDLTHLQGSVHYNNAGVPVFNKLWKEFLSHDRIQDTLHHHIRQHKAEGGAMLSEHEEKIRQDGRHGDSRTALMPRPMVEYLEQNFGKSINPYDGKPEFYLGDLLSGASRFFSPLASSLYRGMSSLGQAAYRGASRAGSAAYRGASNAGQGLRSAASSLYNRMPSMPSNPFRRAEPRQGEIAPRTWADTFGSAGRTAGNVAGNLGGRMIGTGAGAIAGPAVTQLAARGMFPYVPRIVRDPLAGLVGGMVGAPAGSFLGSRIGQRVGASLGERGGRLVGRGVDYLAGNYAPLAARAQNAATSLGSGLSSAASAISHAARNPGEYTPASLMTRRAGEMFSAGLPGVPTAPAREGWGEWAGRHAGNALSAINSYSPATMAANAMSSLPQFSGAGSIRPGGDSPMIDTRRRDGSAYGMAGFTDDAAMPLLGPQRGRRDSADSFMTARSGSPELPWPMIDEPD